MKNQIQKIGYTFVWIFFLIDSYFANAIGDFWVTTNIKEGVKWSNDTADVVIQNLVWTASWFLALIAVLYLLYGWWNILTAGWEEDKVKKWKTIVIQAIMGLGVIFLAYSIVNWLIKLILVPNA